MLCGNRALPTLTCGTPTQRPYVKRDGDAVAAVLEEPGQPGPLMPLRRRHHRQPALHPFDRPGSQPGAHGRVQAGGHDKHQEGGHSGGTQRGEGGRARRRECQQHDGVILVSVLQCIVVQQSRSGLTGYNIICTSAFEGLAVAVAAGVLDDHWHRTTVQAIARACSDCRPLRAPPHRRNGRHSNAGQLRLTLEELPDGP